MSRVRVSYVLAFFGILITTGGCSSSATAPEAASVDGFATAKAVRDTSTVGGGGQINAMSGGLLPGGGRSADVDN